MRALCMPVYCTDEYFDSPPTHALFNITEKTVENIKERVGAATKLYEADSALLDVSYRCGSIYFIEAGSKLDEQLEDANYSFVNIHKKFLGKHAGLPYIKAEFLADTEYDQICVDRFGVSWKSYIDDTSIELTTDSMSVEDIANGLLQQS